MQHYEIEFYTAKKGVWTFHSGVRYGYREPITKDDVDKALAAFRKRNKDEEHVRCEVFKLTRITF